MVIAERQTNDNFMIFYTKNRMGRIGQVSQFFKMHKNLYKITRTTNGEILENFQKTDTQLHEAQ